MLQPAGNGLASVLVMLWSVQSSGLNAITSAATTIAAASKINPVLCVCIGRFILSVSDARSLEPTCDAGVFAGPQL